MLSRHVVTRFLLILVICAGFALLTYRLHGSPRQGIDDADITLVYASHLAHGQGLVYNAGGERVEGFTSVLWVLVCTLIVRMLSSPDAALRILSVGLVAATHTAITLYLDRMSHRSTHAKPPLMSWASTLYLGLVCASPAYVTWMTITLMDTCLWGTLLGLTAAYLLHEPADDRHVPVGLCVLVFLLVLARPESFVVCPAIIAIRWAKRWLTGNPAVASARAAIWPSVTFVTTAGALTILRLSYFGYPLPNTYYAKVSPSLTYNLKTGLLYLGSYLSSTPVVAVSVFVMVLFLGHRLAELLSGPVNRESIRVRRVVLAGPVTTIAALCAVLLVTPALSGGDHFPWWRFYQPAYPLLILGLVCVVAEVQSRFAPSVVIFSIAFVFFVVKPDVGWLGRWVEPQLGLEFRLAESGRRLGSACAQVFGALTTLPSVGSVTSGGFKRMYPGEVIDLMGLSSVAMGHSPGDREGTKNHAAFSAPVFLRLLPDIVTPTLEIRDPGEGGKPITGPDPKDDWVMSIALHHLSDDARFRALYRYGGVHTRESMDATWVVGYFLKSFISALHESGLYDVRLAE